MRWVWTATLGVPMEPEVSRYLATSSGWMAAWACITAGPSDACISDSNDNAPGTVSAPLP